MITDSTNWFLVYPPNLEGSRLDFAYQHPAFEEIRQFRKSSRAQRLGDIVTSPEYGLSESGRDEGEVGFLNVQHLTPYGRIIFEPETYLPECSPEKLLQVDDVLIARTGHTLGKAARVSEQFKGYTYGSFCLRFRVLPNQPSSTDFIVHFINSRWGQNQILMLKTGAGKYNLNSGQVEDIRIPDLDEDSQKRILGVVEGIEQEALQLENLVLEAREVTKALLPTKLAVPYAEVDSPSYFFKVGAENRTLSFHMFPEQISSRLHYLMYHPRFATLDHLKSRYNVTTLAAISAEPITRGTQPDYDDDGDITVIKTANLKNSYIDFENCLTVSRDFYQEYAEIHPEGILHRNDILIASTGYVSMGKVDVYDRDEPALVDGHISILRVDPNEYDPYFVAYFLRSHLGQLQFEKWFTGSSGQIEIQPGDLERFILPDCSKAGVSVTEQRSLAAELTAQFERVHRLEQRAEKKLQNAKDTFERAIAEALGEPSRARQATSESAKYAQGLLPLDDSL